MVDLYCNYIDFNLRRFFMVLYLCKVDGRYLSDCDFVLGLFELLIFLNRVQIKIRPVLSWLFEGKKVLVIIAL